MSTETPEKSFYQVKREKLAAALVAWQNDPTSNDEANFHPLSDADALEDALREHGLQVVPIGPVHSRWRVLIDGQPAPYIGQSRPSGPVDTDMAAEMFLVAALGAEESEREVSVVVRPATGDELVRADVLGDTTVRGEDR